MTGANFLAYVKQIFKRTDKDTEIYTAVADAVMDMRSRMISEDALKVSAALTGCTTIGSYTLTLPTDFGHLIGDVLIKDTAADDVYLPLTRISKPEWDIKYNQALATAVGNRLTGTPLHYCLFGGVIYIGSPVDKTTYEFKINYSLEDEPTYTAVTATIPFTDQFREVVRAGTLQRMFREVGNYPESDIWGAVYIDGVMNIIENDDFNRDGSVQQMNYSGI
jgi:hypothetical protein